MADPGKRNELLRRVARYVQNGMPAEEANQFVASQSDYEFTSVQQLSEAIALDRNPKFKKDAEPAQTLPQRVGDFVTGLGQNASQGAFLGHGDEIAGAMAAAKAHPAQFVGALSGLANPLSAPAAAGNIAAISGPYREDQQGFEESAKAFAAKHPYWAGGANAVGMLGGMAATGLLGGPAGAGAYVGAAAGEPLLAGLASRVGSGGFGGLLSRGITRAAPFAEAAGRGALEGSIYGGIYGAGESPTLGDVPGGMAAGQRMGGAIGGTLGVGLPLMAEGLSGINLWSKKMRSDPATLAMNRDVQIGGALAEDAAVGGGIGQLDRMVEAGAPLVIPADAGGFSGALGRRSSNLNPGLRPEIIRTVDAREAARAPAMQGALEKVSGMTQAEATAGKVEAQKVAREIGKEFDALEARPIAADSPYARLLEQIKEWAKPREAPDPAWQYIQNMNAERVARGQPPLKPAPGAPAPSATAAPPPPFGPRVARRVIRVLRDYGDGPLTVGQARAIEKDLNGAIKQGFDVKGPSYNKNVAAATKDILKQLDDAMLATDPDVAVLKSRYEGAMAQRDAWVAGTEARKAPDAKAAIEQRDALIERGGPVAQRRFAQGMMDDWLRTIGQSSPEAANAMVKRAGRDMNPLRSEAGLPHVTRDVLATGMTEAPSAIGGSEGAMGLLGRHHDAVKMQIGTDMALGGNSTTAAQAADLVADPVTGAMVHTAQPTVGRAIAQLSRDVITKMASMPTRQIAGDVGRTLLRPYGPEVRTELLRMLEVYGEKAFREAMRNRLLTSASSAGAALSPGDFPGLLPRAERALAP